MTARATYSSARPNHSGAYGISLGGEQSTKVDTILVVRVCPGLCGTGSRRVGAVYVFARVRSWLPIVARGLKLGYAGGVHPLFYR